MSLEVDVRKLDLFNKIAKEGSQRVSDHLNQMAGLDTEIAVSKINFLDIEDVRTHMGNSQQVGIFVELTESPYGYVLFMLSPSDAKELAGLLVGSSGGDISDGFTDMERSAIQEVGNIMTSGYIDGWANVLETTINMSTPSFAYGPASGIIDEMGGWPDEDIAFVIDSQLTAGEDDNISLSIYTFPQLVALVELIQNIDISTVIGEDTQASSDIAGNI